MKNEMTTADKKKLVHDLTREWNQAEEFGAVHRADFLLDKINKLSKEIEAEGGW